MATAREVVFVVDRDHAVRDSIGFSIALEGMEVRTCGSVVELLGHPELGNGCCAIIDGKTLYRDGPDALAKLKMGCKGLPVVLIVDHVSRKLLARAIDEGLFEVVDKPVLDDVLIRCVRALCRS